MANPMLQNPIVVEVIQNLGDFLADVIKIQEVLDVVRAEIVENVAVYVEAESQLAQARRRLLDAAAARLAPPGGLAEVRELADDPEVTALLAAYAELAEYVGALAQVRGLLAQALGSLVMLRAAAFAVAVAYVASGGSVVPGPASLVRIFVIVMCFLLGVRD